MQESMSLKYEPVSEPLHVSVKWRACADGLAEVCLLLEDDAPITVAPPSSSLLLSSLELSDTQVYEP